MNVAKQTINLMADSMSLEDAIEFFDVKLLELKSKLNKESAAEKKLSKKQQHIEKMKTVSIGNDYYN